MSFKFCPECGYKFDKEYKFCPECGYKLSEGDKKPEPLFNFSEDTSKYTDIKFALEEEELKKAIKHYDATEINNHEELKKDFPIFKKFAEKGNAEAQFYLGACYGNGTVPVDDDKWFYWMQKSAEQGYANAQGQMGEYYESDNDNKKAMYWYQKAAEQDKFYKHDVERVKEKILKEEQPSVEAYKTPEEEELDWALRNCDLSCEEYKKAFSIIKKYSEKGNAEAQYTLGLCYKNGDVVPQDFKMAYYWHKKAADQGHENAKWEIEHWDFE